MARDWGNHESTIRSIEARLAERASDNSAAFPISIVKEMDDTGQWVWVVDVHVRRVGVTEYEVTGSDPDLGEALRRAYLGLNNEDNLRRWADASNATFGVTP